jgi:hypothetical protein
MKTHKFARKTFYVDAVRVSEANIEEVAAWCSGTIKTDPTGHTYIDVEVDRPLNDRQTQGYIGDWVLSSVSGKGFKVYTPKAFDKSFEKVKTLTKEQADAAGIVVPHEPRPANEQPKHGNKEQGLPSPGSMPKKKSSRAKRREPRVGHVGQAIQEAQAKISTSNENPDAVAPAKKETAVGEGVDYRSAETGQYVSEETAQENPETTVAEAEMSHVRKSKADIEADKLVEEVRKIAQKPEPR